MEHVLVIPRTLLDELGSFQGFQPDASSYMPAIFNPANNFFMERSVAELDPTHKQIIPYVIFHHNGRYLCYTRGTSGGEQRLVAKLSIGIGGHINPTDHDHLGEQMYFNGVEREMSEELHVIGGYTQKVVGLINDDSNEVGMVHLGIVHLFELMTDDVKSKEDAIQDLQFVSLAELQANMENLETWSAICVQQHLELLPTTYALPSTPSQ